MSEKEWNRRNGYFQRKGIHKEDGPKKQPEAVQHHLILTEYSGSRDGKFQNHLCHGVYSQVRAWIMA